MYSFNLQSLPSTLNIWAIMYFSNDVDNFFVFVSKKKISSVLRVLQYMLLKQHEKLDCKLKISYINRMKLKIFDKS